MKKMVLILCSMLMATNMLAQNGEPKTIGLTEAERTLVEHNSDFAFNLFRMTRGIESHVISPLSITYALGMLNNGATGETQQQINEVLGGQTATPAVINSFCRKMLDAVNTLDEKTKVMISDNIYVNEASGFHLLPDFVQSAHDYYNATPETRNFYDGQTRDVINQWASEHTEGLIKEPLKEEEFNPAVISYLLNALYFKGDWTSPFDERPTEKMDFNNGKATADMMAKFDQFKYGENDVCQSIQLPYGNGAFLMTVFLPWSDKTLDDLLAKMEGDSWNAMTYDNYMVNLMLPRFETETDQRLEDIMKELGMPRAFDPYEAQFDKFAVNEDQPGVPIYIDFMKQVGKIRVNESGTEAAAVTIVGMKNGASPDWKTADFIADRPFLYIISERSTGTIFFIGQYMGEPIKNQRRDISLTEEERQLVKSNNDFAFRLFQQARGEESKVLSPLSVTYALGMLNNAADGQTQQEINEVLGFGDAGVDGINNFCRKLLTEVPTLDEETKAEIANTIFVNSGMGFELQQGFIDKANEFYDAQPESRDFNDGKTRDVINQWASDHTEGMIKEVLTEPEFNPLAVSYLLNAIYFKGLWSTPFKADNTKEETFNGDDSVPMMHLVDVELQYAEDDLCQTVVLPYGNGAYQMQVFLPREGKTIDEMFSNIKDHSLHLTNCQVDLKLPRFDTSTNIDLKNIMSALGMPTAFNPYMADFSKLCTDTYGENIYIGLMKQVAKIEVSEQGTEAAAVTIIGYDTTAMLERATFHANRPFFYVISEKSTGIILFMGQYVGTTTTGIGTMPNDKGAMINDKMVYDLRGRRLTPLNVQENQLPLKKGLYIVGGKKVIR